MFDKFDIKELIEQGKKIGHFGNEFDITIGQLVNLVNLNHDPIEVASDAINVGRYLGYMQAINEIKNK